MAEAAPSSRLMVLMFTDIVGSTDLKRKLGDSDVAKMIRRHDELFRYTVGAFPFAEILKDVGDGFLARFNSASDAVHAALHFQQALHQEKWAHPIQARVGLHLGEVSELEREPTSGQAKLSGLAVDITARVMGLALPGQILMTRAAFDNARQYVREHPTSDGEAVPITRKWMAHGRYMFKGAEEALEVFEVGEVGIAPLQVPPDSEKARRAVAADQEETLGWRPAVGMEIPERKGWMLDRKLGEGGFGEVWLGEHFKTKTRRVFKFCFDAERLKSFKRELMLFRLLRDALGDRNDIAKLHEVQVEHAPFYLESEFTEDGSLVEWSERQGGIAKIPLQTRIDLVARTAIAVAAAHSVGVLHKDIKPSNILVYRGEGGAPMPRLTDFGIGVLTDPNQLKGRNITMVGATESIVTGRDSGLTGTRIYTPPEALIGKPFTMQGDVYALGVLLYQMVIGDLDRPIAQGWEREIPDPLLRQDIAVCVEGHEMERLSSAKELADRLQTLPARRRARQRKRIARASALVSVLLVVLLSLTAAVLVREKGLRAKAERELAKSTAMLGFFSKMFKSVDPYKGGGKDARVADVLDASSQEIDKTFASQRELASALHGFIGRGYKDLGLYPEAATQLEPAIQARRELNLPPSNETAQMLEDLAASYYWEDKYSAALPLYDEALAMRREVFGPESKEVASSLNHLAACKDALRDREAAEALYRQALEMRERVLTPSDPEYVDLFASMNNLATCLRGQGKLKESEEISRKALERLRSQNPPNEAAIATTLTGLATTLTRNPGGAGRAEAIQLLNEALVLKRKELGDDHPQLTTTLHRLAEALLANDEAAAAEPLFRESLHIRVARLQPDHLWIAESQVGLGRCLLAMKRYEEADTLLNQGYNSYASVTTPGDGRTKRAIDELVKLYTAWGKPEKAAEFQAKVAQNTPPPQGAQSP